MRPRVCASAVLVVVAAASAACKQAAAQTWRLDAYAGRANYKTLPASVSSNSGVLGIRFNRDYRFFQASLGVPLRSQDVTWGLVGWGDRFAVRSGDFSAGMDVAAYANAERDPVANAAGGGLLAEALPMISRSVRAFSLELRSGARWYGAKQGGENSTRTLWANDLRARVQTGEAFQFESDVRHERGRQGEAYTRVGFATSGALRQIALHVGVGDWISGVPDTKPEWDASLSIPLRQGLSLFTSAQHESFNPQFLAPPRTSWGVGLTFRIGGRSNAEDSDAIEISKGGAVVIRVPGRESAGAPSIVGDFTSWMPVVMERRGDEWIFPVELSPGVYHFAFRATDGKWFVPDSIPGRVDDGMGGVVAVLVVP